MSSEAIALCLDELEEAETGLLSRLTALQAYAVQGVSDETRTWIETDSSGIRDRLSLLESLKAWLLTVQGTDYPLLAHAPMPEAVQINLGEIQFSQTAAVEASRVQMALIVSAPPRAEENPLTDARTEGRTDAE